jgi:hypothetical protein
MAGNYPDAPSNRMLLDRDGAQMYKVNMSNVITQLSSAQIQALNSETSKGVGDFNLHGQNEFGSLVVFFPERRDVAGYYFNFGVPGFGGVSMQSAEVSTNTTNGIDGTWTAIPIAGYGEPMSPNFRSKIQTITALGIRAMRFRTSAGAPSYGCFPSVHIYGNPSSGQNPNRLAIWHPTSDAHISGAYYDWGDTPRSSSADRTCRVKNMSATLKAEAITVAFDILTDTTPSVPAQFLVSEDGLTFTATADIGDLPAGGISPILTVRRNTPTNAALSVWEPRIIAQASDWS